jgi:hypothetical protein
MLNNTCFVIIKTNDRGALAPTLYADDIITFANGKYNSISNLAQIIKDFEWTFNQKVNASKSFYFVGNISPLVGFPSSSRLWVI